MILCYPSGWPNSSPPYYLIAGDKAFYILDGMSVWNLMRVGIPTVPFTPANLAWVLEKLDPNVEHPLSTA